MNENNVPVRGNSFTNGDYVWFIGKVENVNDPEMDGRVQVRIMGYHPDAEGQIAVGDLPWSQVEHSSMSAATKGIGFGPHGLIVGTFVKGHFIDGHDAQMPMVTATFAGIDDTHDLIKGKNTVKKTLLSANGVKEPASPYGAKYPHNKVMTTTSGHVIEIDDTPGKERIHVYHKSGTYIEFHPDGKAVYRHFGGTFFLTNGNCSQITTGDYKHVVGENMEFIVGGNTTIKSNGSVNIQSGSTMNIKAGSSANIQAGSSMTLKAGGMIKANGSVINLN